MKVYKVFEVVKQVKPSLLFPDEPVSKRKSFAGIRCRTEQEARSRAVEDEFYKYEVRERVFRYVKKSGFMKGKGEMLGKLIPVHDVEVRETISLRTV